MTIQLLVEFDNGKRIRSAHFSGEDADIMRQLMERVSDLAQLMFKSDSGNLVYFNKAMIDRAVFELIPVSE